MEEQRNGMRQLKYVEMWIRGEDGAMTWGTLRSQTYLSRPL
jgi:hypothetical protein